MGGTRDWDLVDAARQIRGLPDLHASIADDHGARYGDRSLMDRAAFELFAAATAVNDAHASLMRLKAGPKGPALPQEVVHAARRLHEAKPADPYEAFLTQLVTRTLDNKYSAEEERGLLGRLPLRAVLERPGLLAALAPISRDHVEDLETRGWPVALVRDPVLASALLARPPLAQGSQARSAAMHRHASRPGARERRRPAGTMGQTPAGGYTIQCIPRRFGVRG